MNRENLKVKLRGPSTLPATNEAVTQLAKLAESLGGEVLSITTTLQCDGCPTAIPFDPSAEQSIWDAANVGWTRTPHGHYCPKCSKETDMLSRIDKIRELHYDAGFSQGYFEDGYSARDHCCAECGSHGEYGVEWPCPTVRILDGSES